MAATYFTLPWWRVLQYAVVSGQTFRSPRISLHVAVLGLPEGWKFSATSKLEPFGGTALMTVDSLAWYRGTAGMKAFKGTKTSFRLMKSHWSDDFIVLFWERRVFWMCNVLFSLSYICSKWRFWRTIFSFVGIFFFFFFKSPMFGTLFCWGLLSTLE